ncbi:MAG: hypothetical protein DWI03_05200 [Planctomycetota bacterium]|jgi:hypothetical protein|nr:MAG: hypothetical protein DWI03_05200 [Planctomycetota bacterium]
MGHFFFYLAVVAACLLWSAAFTAAAARSRPGRGRDWLGAVAAIVPPLVLVPWVVLTAILAFRMRLEANWFTPTLMAAISALIGSVWIARAGLTPSAAPTAATWPLMGLAALCVLAKAVAAGTLLFIDNAVAAEGRMLRVEAAQIMATVLPPAAGPDANAAPLYLRAFAALAADKQLGEAESPFKDPLTADVTSPEVSAILERHAATLDLLRRATDKPGCRFDRDWSRLSFDMLLPEVVEMRLVARLLTLAARREAAAGDVRQALDDVVRIHHVGLHVAGEPTLVSGLVGQAIDALALMTLADVLPRLGTGDLPLLDAERFWDFVATPITYQRAFWGDEAIGLATLGDLAAGVDGMSALELLRSISVPVRPMRQAFDGPFSFLYRCFMLPADIAGYRSVMGRFRDLVGQMQESALPRFPTIAKQTARIEDAITSRRPGIFSVMLTPSLVAMITSQVRGRALHDVAEVLVAMTRARLAGTSIAESLPPETLAALPADPFTADEPLLAKRSVDGWVVYSVGPDGEDDGGPADGGVDADEGNDDVGLQLAVDPAPVRPGFP